MNNLSQFKKLQEVKQSALAKEIGNSESYLSLIINGFRELTPKTADKIIANALRLTEVDYAMLFDNEKEAEEKCEELQRCKKLTDLNEIPKAKKNYPHCLRFVLKGVWFDKIKSGEKRIEYREVKPYWDKRIRNLYHFNNTPDFNKCIFTRGYTSEMLIAEIERIEIICGLTTDLHINKNVYAIHITNIREFRGEMNET